MISAAFAAEAAGAEPHSILEAPELWVAVAFFLVVGFAARPVARALTSALDARRDKIRARLEEAQRLREDAQALLAEYQKKQRDAMKEAEAILDHARAEAERLAAQAAADLEASLKRREQQAVDRIAQAEAQALKEVRNTAVDVAMTATRQIIADNLTDKQAAKLIDGAIKDLPGRLH